MKLSKYILVVVLTYTSHAKSQEEFILKTRDSVELTKVWKHFTAAALKKDGSGLKTLMRPTVDCFVCTTDDSIVTNRTLSPEMFIERLFQLMNNDTSLAGSMNRFSHRIWVSNNDLNINSRKPAKNNNLFYNISCHVISSREFAPRQKYEGLRIFQFIKDRGAFKLYAFDVLP